MATGGLASVVLRATRRHRPLRTVAHPVRLAHHLPSEPRRWLKISLTGSMSRQPAGELQRAICRVATGRGVRRNRYRCRAHNAAAGDGQAHLYDPDRLDRLGAAVRRGAVDPRFSRAQQAFARRLGGRHRRSSPHPDRRAIGQSPATGSSLPRPAGHFADKWHGITDVDTRYRQRYADMWANRPLPPIACWPAAGRSRLCAVSWRTGAL